MDLPKSWGDITVEQYYKLFTINNLFKNVVEKNIKILSLFTGQTEKEIEELSVTYLFEQMKVLSFLNELPSEKITPYFELKKKKYKACIIFSDMKAGQFIDFSYCGQGCTTDELPYHMHELLAAMCLTKIDGKYVYEGYDKTSEDFLEIPISIAYPFYLFFCNVLTNLQNPILDFSRKMAEKQMKEMKKILA